MLLQNEGSTTYNLEVKIESNVRLWLLLEKRTVAYGLVVERESNVLDSGRDY